MNKKPNTNGIMQRSRNVNLKAYYALAPFLFSVRWVKQEIEDMVSRIHLVFFKNMYPSIKH